MMAAEEQPTEKDKSTEDMWDLNRKLMTSGEMFDHRVIGHNLKGDIDGHNYDGRIENLNQKIVADAQAQAIFWQNIQERQASLKLASQELLERSQNFWTTMRERQDQHSDQRSQSSVLNNIDENKARMLVPVELRTVEPTREESIQDATAAAVNQAVDTVTRAMVDRTQTSAANVSELSASRQVTDVNVLATAQAAFQALTNQVAELTGVVQAQAK
jgi:hypothetical protein